MSYTIQAQPTRFNRIDFRSKTEARIAAFLSAFGVVWAYEPFNRNGWSLDLLLTGSEGRTLPVEIKPEVFVKDSLFEKVANGYPDGDAIILTGMFSRNENLDAIQVGYLVRPEKTQKGIRAGVLPLHIIGGKMGSSLDFGTKEIVPGLLHGGTDFAPSSELPVFLNLFSKVERDLIRIA